MNGYEVKLSTWLVDSETWCRISERNKQIGHQPPEEVTTTVVFRFEDPNRYSFRHSADV